MISTIAWILILVAFVLGVGLAKIFNQNAIKKRKAFLLGKRRAKQKKLLEKFRIEIKNNTIRLKKELNRLILTKTIIELDLIFRHYNSKLYKVKNKFLAPKLFAFYDEIIIINSDCKMFEEIIEKVIVNNSHISDEDKTILKSTFIAAVQDKIEAGIESGTTLVTEIEDALAKG